MFIMPNLFPESATFKTPSDSAFAKAVLQARIDFIMEVQWALRSLQGRLWMGTTGTNLARAAVSIAEIESRYSTLVDCAIEEKLAKSRA